MQFLDFRLLGWRCYARQILRIGEELEDTIDGRRDPVFRIEVINHDSSLDWQVRSATFLFQNTSSEGEIPTECVFGCFVV